MHSRLPSFMSAQFEGVLCPQALRWVWFFFCKMGDTSDEISVCTQGALLLVTVDWAHFSKGQSFTFWGSCHSTSSRGTLLASNIFSGQRAAGGWWTLRKRHVLTVIALICSFCSFRVLADSNCDLKYSYDLWQLCVNLEDFYFFFQDEEKQRQRSHSWIKNKRTVDSTDKIHFQRSGDENESVSLSHCWRLKKKEMRLCF